MLPWWETKSRGIYIYGLSPFYQKAFTGVPAEYKRMAKNGFRNALTIVPLCLAAYGLTVWAEHENHKRKRKEYLKKEEL